MKKNYSSFLFIFLISLGQSAQAQAPVLTSLNPARNTRNAPVATNVALTFDQSMSNGAATLGALRVFSHQHGGQLRNGAGGVTIASGNTLTLNPTANFKPGETIFTTITSQAQNSSGTALAHGLVYQFTTQVGGTGRGNFQATPTTSVGSAPQDIRTGDLNNDGNLDLVVANNSSNTVSIRLGTGTGTFTTPASGSELSAPNSTLGVSVGDVDNDGDLDLLAAGSTTVNLYTNNGAASFSAPTAITIGANASSLSMGDVDGDGDLDFVVANSDAGGAGSTASLRLNNGSGQFTAPATGSTITLGSGPLWVALHDLDGDNDLDLLATNVFSNSLSVRLNNGSGQFTAPASNAEVSTGSFPNVFAVGDIDGDGDLDVAVGNGGDNTASILANDGNGQLTPLATIPLGNQSQSVALGDIDSDGDLDLLSANSIDNTLSVQLNDGTGTFTAPSTNANPNVGGSFPVVVILADVDNDDDLDALTNNFYGNTVSVLLNQPFPPTITDFLPNPDPVCTGNQVTFTASLGNLTGSYSYTLTNGTSTTTGTSSNPSFSQTVTASETGTQTYSLIVNSNSQLVTETYDLTVSQLPDLSLESPDGYAITCNLPTLMLMARGGENYVFSGPGILSQEVIENRETYMGIAEINTAGLYSVTASYGETGCFSVTTVSINSDTNAPNASISPSSLTLTCANPTATLTASGGETYVWNTGAPTQILNVSASGTYSVTVTGANGCTAIKTTTVGSNTALTLSAGASLPLANVGVVVSLTASAGVAAYQWSAPASAPLTTPATSSAVSASLTTAGVQTFTVIATAGVCSQSALVSVTALAGPDLSAIMSLPEANFPAGDAKGLLVQLQEVNGAATSAGNIVLTLTMPTGYSVSFDNTLTSINVAGGSENPVSVSNPKWHITSTIANQQISLTINGGEFIAARGVMNLGFTVNRTSANSGSSSNITVNVADDSSGTYDVNRSNNIYARIITGL
ncbi:beta strand repeat-containing protein [Spirosoma gilvum]